MSITEQDVRHVAHLARLHLTPQQLRHMTEQLATILSYVDKLNELDTDGVEPTTHAFSAVNAFRDDRVEPSLPRLEALANAPHHNGEAFIVPRII